MPPINPNLPPGIEDVFYPDSKFKFQDPQRGITFPFDVRNEVARLFKLGMGTTAGLPDERANAADWLHRMHRHFIREGNDSIFADFMRALESGTNEWYRQVAELSGDPLPPNRQLDFTHFLKLMDSAYTPLWTKKAPRFPTRTKFPTKPMAKWYLNRPQEVPLDDLDEVWQYIMADPPWGAGNAYLYDWGAPRPDGLTNLWDSLVRPRLDPSYPLGTFLGSGVDSTAIQINPNEVFRFGAGGHLEHIPDIPGVIKRKASAIDPGGWQGEILPFLHDVNNIPDDEIDDWASRITANTGYEFDDLHAGNVGRDADGNLFLLDVGGEGSGGSAFIWNPVQQGGRNSTDDPLPRQLPHYRTAATPPGVMAPLNVSADAIQRALSNAPSLSSANPLGRVGKIIRNVL